MELRIKWSSRIKKDLKKYRDNKPVLKALYDVLGDLVKQKPLDPKYEDHPLKNNWKGYRECHVQPDTLLIYTVEDDELLLVRFGSHSELF